MDEGPIIVSSDLLEDGRNTTRPAKLDTVNESLQHVSVQQGASPASTVSQSSTHADGKNNFLTNIQSLSSWGSTPVEDKPAWLPTLLQPRPLVGIAALLLSAGCLVASLGVLLGSNGRANHAWTWQPSVFLAALSAVSNTCVQFALAQAIPVAWWYHASCGSTIGQLQKEWEAGQGLFHAVRHMKHTTLLTIATVASALVVIDGPFLQKVDVPYAAATDHGLTSTTIL